jgi:hypothetical protein
LAARCVASRVAPVERQRARRILEMWTGVVITFLPLLFLSSPRFISKSDYFLPLLEVEMLLEAALYLLFAAVAGIVKAYKRRQDVLYGPYISQDDRN